MESKLPKTTFQILHFSQIGQLQWHKILCLRSEIFVLEQNCPYIDPDDIDLDAFHLILTIDSIIIGTARIYESFFEKKPCFRIGRVALKKVFRSKKLGKQIMLESLAFCAKNNADFEVVISAQEYLDRFYSNLNFHSTGKKYLEDGIPHQEMIYVKH